MSESIAGVFADRRQRSVGVKRGLSELLFLPLIVSSQIVAYIGEAGPK
jgi:hypothetical protein